MHTSVCFKTVIKCKIATYWRFKFKDFSRTFKYFQAPYLFSSTFKGLEFFFKIQAFSRISQARYEPCYYHLHRVCWPSSMSLYNLSMNAFSCRRSSSRRDSASQFLAQTLTELPWQQSTITVTITAAETNRGDTYAQQTLPETCTK